VVVWEVEVTDEFAEWYKVLPEQLQDAITAKVELLEQYGPYLGRPHADSLAKMSTHSNMKELIVQHGGDAHRILFAFDPRRVAILLLGDRKPDNRWYKEAVPQADRLYDEHLRSLREEGLL